MKKKCVLATLDNLKKMFIFTQKAITLHAFYFIRNQASSLA